MSFSETSMLVSLFVFMVNLTFTMVSVALDLFFGAALFILCADCQVQDIIVGTTPIGKVDAVFHMPTSASRSESVIQHCDRCIHRDLSDQQRIAQFEIDVETLTERLALRDNEKVAFEHLTAYLSTVIEDKNVQISSLGHENEQKKIRLQQENTRLQQQNRNFGLFIADQAQAHIDTKDELKSVKQELERAYVEIERANMEILETKADAVRHSRKVKRLSSVVKQRGELALKLARRPIFFDSKSLPGAPIAAMLPTPPPSPALVNASFDNESAPLCTSVSSTESAVSPLA